MKANKCEILVCVIACLFLFACAKRPGLPPASERRNIMQSAMEAYAQGDCRKSIMLFTQALQWEQHPTTYNGLGMAQLQCEQPSLAVDSFKKALSLAPGSPSLHSNLGTAYFADRNYKNAGAEFETALRYDPLNPEALLGKAGVLLEQGKPDSALAVLKQLKGKQAPEVIYDRALILYRLGIYDDAENALKDYINVAGGDAQAYNALAITLLELKKDNEALENINRAIDLEPMEGKYYYNRGNINKALKNFKKAIDDYGRAIAYNPTFAEAFVNRGDLLFLERDTVAGCQDLEEACKLGRCERLEKFRDMGRCLTGIWQNE